MDLNQISVVARERRSWEALDLGFVLARKWYRPLFLAWLIPSFLIFVVFSVLFINQPWVGITVCWWLKPLWDRLPLHIASRGLFGESVSVRSTLRSAFGIMKKDLFAWLLWRRFSLTRSFDLPVTVLEGLKGEARRKRLNVLHIDSSSAATWLTIVCIHLEMTLVLGGIGMILLFIPEEVAFSAMDMFQFDSSYFEWLFNALSYIAMVLVAPFYTLAGFALYISRRISLEGWDVEIQFRQLAERYAETSLPVVEPAQAIQGTGT